MTAIPGIKALSAIVNPTPEGFDDYTNTKLGEIPTEPVIVMAVTQRPEHEGEAAIIEIFAIIGGTDINDPDAERVRFITSAKAITNKLTKSEVLDALPITCTFKKVDMKTKPGQKAWVVY